MPTKLMFLEPHARESVTQTFVEGQAVIDIAKHLKPFSRDVDLDALIHIVDHGVRKFGSALASKSDAWLAPRVHATLRLTRREAADSRVWEYLAVCILPEYVRWRWQAQDRKKRFVGSPEYIQAVARLWWGAELTRNGPDYTLSRLLYQNQDLQNSWARCKLFNHRPTALASLQVLSTLQSGEFASSDQIRDLIKSFNMALTTTLLDSVVPDLGVDAEAIAAWVTETIDETHWHEDDPIGPAELPVDPSAIAAATALLLRVIDKTKFAKRQRKPSSQAEAEAKVVETVAAV